MKKTIFATALALFLMAGTMTFAQAGKPGPQKGEQFTVEQIAQSKTDRIVKNLSLNDEQAKKIYDLNLTQAKEMKAQREKMQAKREARAAEMKKILTTEQYTQWEQMRGPKGGMNGQAHHGKMQKHQGKRGMQGQQGQNCGQCQCQMMNSKTNE